MFQLRYWSLIEYSCGVTDREVYPNAPLVLVAAEVRHPAAGPLTGAEQAALKRLLADDLPLSNPATVRNVTAVMGGPAQVQESVSPRFTTRDRTTAVTFHSGALVVETTRYGQFERLRDLLLLALDARLSVGSLDGFERVGLRYIDEIRVPDSNGSALGAGDAVEREASPAWEQWLAESLVGPALLGPELGLRAAQWQGLTVFGPTGSASPDDFDSGGGRGSDSLVLRYGPAEGYALDPGGELKRAVPPPGPFFLLDVDSFWTSPSEIPPMDREELIQIVTRLHAPVRSLFEALITARLREEVLRNAR